MPAVPVQEGGPANIHRDSAVGLGARPVPSRQRCGRADAPAACRRRTASRRDLSARRRRSRRWLARDECRAAPPRGPTMIRSDGTPSSCSSATCSNARSPKWVVWVVMAAPVARCARAPARNTRSSAGVIWKRSVPNSPIIPGFDPGTVGAVGKLANDLVGELIGAQLVDFARINPLAVPSPHP